MKWIHKIGLIGSIMIGGMLLIGVSDFIGTSKIGSSYVIGDYHYRMIKSRYTLDDELILDNKRWTVIGIEKTENGIRYTLLNEDYAISVKESEVE